MARAIKADKARAQVPVAAVVRAAAAPKVVPAVRAAVWATPSAVLVAAQIRPAPVCRWVAPPRPVTARPPAQVQAPVPSGMAPMGGAHGRGGHGEEDDEHQTPEFLINWDNGNELFGDLPKASPGVIGDWSEHERAEKQRRESEKRRYKSMGWNVDFGDDD